MPYSFKKTKAGVTVTNKQTGKAFHSPSMPAAKKAAKIRESYAKGKK